MGTVRHRGEIAYLKTQLINGRARIYFFFFWGSARI